MGIFNSYQNKVYSQSISPKGSLITNKDESLNINLSFDDGSIATMQYFSNGSESFPKERIDIFKEDLIISLSDFKDLSIIKDGKVKNYNSSISDKGQKNLIRRVIEKERGNGNPIIDYNSLILTTKATFCILESIKTGNPINFQI